jgi:iron-sulfur cluster repair protein YtfE (RIC family)
MDAIQFLKQQHEEAKQMFGRIEQAQGGEREQLWKKLSPELKAHEQMEEQHLYGPVAREAGGRDRDLAEWEQHHRKEVQEAEALIKKIDGARASDQSWLEQVRQLKSTLEHHIQEEEGKIWPKIRQVWDAGKLEQAGQQMEAAKAKTGRAA